MTLCTSSIQTCNKNYFKVILFFLQNWLQRIGFVGNDARENGTRENYTLIWAQI
jgi:hypothetical protein